MRLAPYGFDYHHDPAFTWRRILAAEQRVGSDPDLELMTTLRVLAIHLPGLRLARDCARGSRPSALIRIHTAMPAITIGGPRPAIPAPLKAAQR